MSLSGNRCSVLVLLMLLAGCRKEPDAGTATAMVPIVTVRHPVVEKVQRYEYFTGRVESNDKVDIRAKVSGYLVKISFTPGTIVEEGKPLFEIDPRPFRVELEKAQASHALSLARENQMKAEFERMDELFKKGSASKSEYDKALANFQEATASVKGAQADIAAAELNLEYTRINAPLTGQIGDKLVSLGNLITGGSSGATLLATIVSVDPIDLAFDIDEATLERCQEAERKGLLKISKPGEFAVQVGLAVHGNEYPVPGVIRFANNVFDAKTGTVKLKASVANPMPQVGQRLFKSGMFARVRVPVGEATDAVLVPESAMLSDQGQKYLFVIGPEDKAVRLDISAGMTLNGRIVIEQVREPSSSSPRALRADERVIVSGVQRVRPGMRVEAKPAPKP